MHKRETHNAHDHYNDHYSLQRICRAFNFRTSLGVGKLFSIENLPNYTIHCTMNSVQCSYQ